VSLTTYNRLTDAEAAHVLSAVCAAPRWVDEVVAGRPYATVDAMVLASDHALTKLSDAEVEQAVAAHPKIGAPPTGPGGEESRREQSAVDTADADLATALAEGNRAYEQRFGRTYLVSASGRSGHELLAMLHQRLGNDPSTELAVTRAELAKINRLRLERLVAS
jgi:2-oxo-4-hydroxy-4-carboxy-5-ureidoimidazoline decarboxylase